MGIRCYRMTSTVTAAQAGVGSSTIVAQGRIVGASYSINAVGGAGTGSCYSEVGLNNTTTTMNANSASGAPSEQLIGRGAIAYGNAGTGQGQNFIPLSIPVRQGNILSINANFTGTAPSFHNSAWDVWVQEGAS